MYVQSYQYNYNGISCTGSTIAPLYNVRRVHYVIYGTRGVVDTTAPSGINHVMHSIRTLSVLL